jgi:hypothetical protein
LPGALGIVWAAAGAELVAQDASATAHTAPDGAAVEALGCGRDIGGDIAALVNGAPLVLADFKVGTTGAADPQFAAALAVDNGPRRKTAAGLELPSEIEEALQHEILSNPCFRSFERAIRQGEDDVSGRGRAIMQIELPITKTYDLTVEYLPGKFRRNYLLQLSFGLEIRDAKGRVVFAKSHGEQYRRTCFWEDAGDPAQADCLDLQGNAVDAAAEWRGLLRHEVQSLLAGVETELSSWRQLLEDASGAFYDRSYSAMLKLRGTAVRSREQLALPYLFVQTPAPPVNVNGLLTGLGERGFGQTPEGRGEFQNHYNVLFRSYLDRSLRGAIAASDAAENARVVLLSDAQSEAFRNAITIACAEQSQGFNAEDCLEPVYLIERLCDSANPEFGKARNPRGDACLRASLVFGRSLTRTNEEGLRNVREAEQRIQAAGFLRLPAAAEDVATVPCASADSKVPVPFLVGVSDTYYRIDAAAQNDDGLYLQDAAVEVVAAHAECLAAHVLQRYAAMDKRNEP